MLQFIRSKMNKKGFTLIELIVVITILGILVAIAAPRFGGLTDNADTAADAASIRTIQSAIGIVEANQGGPYAGAADLAELNALLDGITCVTGDAAVADNFAVSADGSSVLAPTN